MKRFLVLFFISIFSISYAQAELLVEPVIGYNIGSKFDFENGKAYSGGTGAAFGGRLGYQKLGFQVGLDYLHSSIDMDDKDFDKNVSMNEWAGFVGFEFPILLRVYGGYIFSASGETKSNNVDVDLKSGSGFKAGLGFTLLPFLDINFEYRKGTFGEWKAGNTKFDTNVDYNSYMIGLSLPFTI